MYFTKFNTLNHEKNIFQRNQTINIYNERFLVNRSSIKSSFVFN